MRILDFLGSRPEESFGLSDLSRILGMNKATCLTILGALVTTGYVLQDPETREYRLGPSSVALGSAALAQFPGLEPARGVMGDLGKEFGLICLAMVEAANHLVMLGEHGPHGPLRPPIATVGVRAPFVPPLGATLIAWATPTEYEQWLARAVPPLTDAERSQQRRTMLSIRARGFAASRRGRADALLEEVMRPVDRDPNQALSEVVAEAIQRGRGEAAPYVLVDLADTSSYPIAAIAAPVFGPRCRPEFSLVLEGFRWDVTGEEIRHIGARMVEQCGVLSRAIGGDPPEFRPYDDSAGGGASKSARPAARAKRT